jgi:hypothetical protein
MSVRSNENRLGIDPSAVDNENTDLKQVSANPESLKFITPTEFVDLPSKGQFYNSDHPLYNQDVVEIKHMTTKEEDILTSVALLKKGVAIDRMLENLLVDNRIGVDDLLLGDKNALIVAARMHGYGALYETSIKCPDCRGLQEYGFDLNSLTAKFPTAEVMAEHDAQKTENNTFLIPLPKTQYTVEVRFLTGRDEKRVSETQEYKKKHRLADTPISDFLRFIIVSVNQVIAEAPLNEFINSLPALHARYIRKVYDKLIPTVNMEHAFTCPECNYEGALEVPLNADFFWLNT